MLDVGAGVGRYALPLARLARQVVAVEPSPAMQHHLAERIAAANATNLTLVPAAWPAAAAEVAPADIVLCAHVVYGVREIVPFVRALDSHTRRACLIAIRVDQHPGLADISAALFGSAPVRQPALLDLYPLLADLGIVADVQTSPATGSFHFADHEQAHRPLPRPPPHLPRFHHRRPSPRPPYGTPHPRRGRPLALARPSPAQRNRHLAQITPPAQPSTC